MAFHGQNDTEDLIVGGGLPWDRAHTVLKARLAARIANALRAVTDDPPAVVVRPSGPLAGAQQRNIVNRVTAAGNGIQLEQPPSVRDDEQQRDVIAEAVARSTPSSCRGRGRRVPRGSRSDSAQVSVGAASAVDAIVVDTAADAESQAVRDVVDTSVSTRNDASKFVAPWWWGSPLRGMGVFGELAPAG